MFFSGMFPGVLTKQNDSGMEGFLLLFYHRRIEEESGINGFPVLLIEEKGLTARL